MLKTLWAAPLAGLLLLALAGCDSQGLQAAPGAASRAPAALAQSEGTTVRPIQEFLDANSTGGGFLWSERSDRPSDGRRVFIDYAGRYRNQVLAQSGGAVDLPTEYSGRIVERALADGSAEIHVTLHATDALSWSDAGAPGGYAPLFGYNTGAVAGGSTPSLVDVALTFVYTNPAGPGAQIQNITTVSGPYRSHIVINGPGPLRSGFEGAADGDPGQLSVNQRGVVSQGQGNGVADGFPVEFVNIKATGG